MRAKRRNLNLILLEITNFRHRGYLVLPENNGRQSAIRDALSPKEALKANKRTGYMP
jgi:hypothetical protein